MFRAVLWPEGREYRPNPFAADKAGTQDALEVWFTGSHGDVGGGWPEKVSGLAKIPLLWMIEETEALGLDYVTQTVNRLVRGAHVNQPYLPHDPFATVNNSMAPGWKLLEFLPLPVRSGDDKGLKLTRARPRHVGAGARIYGSVVARAAWTGGLQGNIPAYHRVEGEPADWTSRLTAREQLGG